MPRGNRIWKFHAFFLALAVLFLGGTQVFGQSQAITATLSGTVLDASGQAISGAKVNLSNPERGFIRTYTTDSTGLYTFTLLPASAYTLDVEAAGFKHYRQAGISLGAGQSAEQNVNLAIGAVTESIEVTSQAPLMNANDANISSDVSARQVAALPLNLRNVISLAELNSSVSNAAEEQVVGAPGISGSADQDVSFLNFGGTFFNTAEYLLDGSWDTRLDWGGVVYVPSVDDVQEFKIQTNAFTSQYGFSSGNVINVVTKSGSNGFHGDAYEFYRNSTLDARYFYNNGAQPAFRRNQFGGTFGGPIRKDKTFFFAYYEGLRSATPATYVGTMPTAAERIGDFSALLGPQVTDPTTGQPVFDALGRPVMSGAIYNPFSSRQITGGQIDPVTGLLVTGLPAGTTGYIRDPIPGNIIPANLLDTIAGNIAKGNYWPMPTNGNLINNFTSASSAAAQSNEYSVRIDHNFTDSDRVYGRWSQKFQSKINSPTYYGASDEGGPGVTAPNNRYSASVGYNHVFNPTFDVSFNFGVNRHVEQSTTQSFGFQSSTLGLPSFINSIAPSFPEIQPQSYSPLGAQAGLDNYLVPQTIYTSSVDFTKAMGRHTFSFGFTDVSAFLDGGHYANTVLPFSTSTTAGPNPDDTTTGTGNGFASFLLGAGSSGAETGFNQFPAMHKHFLGWYLQDGWKVTPRLTLNLGMRYEIQTAPTERINAQQYFDFTAVNPISSAVGFDVPGMLVFNSGSHRGLYDTAYKNFAPRVGAAYQLRNKVVLRGGYGIFYVPSYYNQGPNIGYSQPTPWVTTLNGINPSSTLSGNASLGLPSAFANGQVPVTGNNLGGLTDVGFGLNPVVNPIRDSPYVQQWMLGLQYSFTNNDLLEINYVGNHGVHVLAQYLEWNEFPVSDLALGNTLNNMVPNPFYGKITSSACGLDQPSIVYGQLLRPYPEYCSVTEAEPAVAGSTYNALQVTYTHRWHSGLDLNLSYTYSKFLDDAQGAAGWAFPGSGSNVRNSYDLAAEHSVDVTDITHSLVANYTYELPFGKGQKFGSDWSRPMNAVLGGWQWSGILTAHTGLPISINPASNNVSGSVGYGFNQRPNLVPGVNPVPQNQSINHWINAAAFSQPDPYTFGDAPRFLSNLRAPGFVNWDMGIQKYWNFTETKRLQFRFELYNLFNHPNFFEPDSNLGDANFGTITAAYPARSLQFAGKFYW
jgi:hypothetical protein